MSFGYQRLGFGAWTSRGPPDSPADTNLDFDWIATNQTFNDGDILNAGFAGRNTGDLEVREQASADIGVTANQGELDCSLSAAGDWSGFKERGSFTGENGTAYVADYNPTGTAAECAIVIADTDHTNADLDTQSNWQAAVQWIRGSAAKARVNGTEEDLREDFGGATIKRLSLITGGFNSAGEPYRTGETRTSYEYGFGVYLDGNPKYLCTTGNWNGVTMWGNFVANDERVLMAETFVDADNHVWNEFDTYDATPTNGESYAGHDLDQIVMLEIANLGTSVNVRVNSNDAGDETEVRFNSDGSIDVETIETFSSNGTTSSGTGEVSAGDECMIVCTNSGRVSVYVNNSYVVERTDNPGADTQVIISYSGAGDADWLSIKGPEAGFATL